jgi:hypothetical protein
MIMHKVIATRNHIPEFIFRCGAAYTRHNEKRPVNALLLPSLGDREGAAH